MHIRESWYEDFLPSLYFDEFYWVLLPRNALGIVYIRVVWEKVGHKMALTRLNCRWIARVPDAFESTALICIFDSWHSPEKEYIQFNKR